MQQMPKTSTYLERMENLFELCVSDYEAYESFNDEEKYIIDNPMLHLAEVICADCPGRNDSWAVDLAKYIFLIKGVDNMKITVQ